MSGSLGRERRLICSRLGHIDGNVVIIEAMVKIGGLTRNLRNSMSILVVLWEGNKERKGMNAGVTSRHTKVFRFGSKGALRVRCCSTASTSGDVKTGG